jgi:hypothetical protein
MTWTIIVPYGVYAIDIRVVTIIFNKFRYLILMSKGVS